MRKRERERVQSHAPHEFEFTIRGDKRDRAVGLELAQLHTPVEGAVVDLRPHQKRNVTAKTPRRRHTAARDAFPTQGDRVSERV